MNDQREHDVVIVGAGVSGRLAKLMRPSALLLEAAAEGKQRAAAMVGINYLHEQVAELPSREVTVLTGTSPDGWSQDVAPGALIPLDGVSMAQYKQKSRGWKADWGDQMSADIHMRERPGRYEHDRKAWAFDMPNVEVVWNMPVAEVRPRDHIVLVSTPDGPLHIHYSVLIWTAPLHALCTAVGLDPQTLEFKGKPIYYHHTHSDNRPAIVRDDRIVVEYVSDPRTPIYRRSFYPTPDGGCDVALESIAQLEGWQAFYPGKIEESAEAEALALIFGRHEIVLAGRFARWDPDELTHHTADRLRRALT